MGSVTTRRGLVGTALLCVGVLVGSVFVTVTLSWRNALAGEQRLLPGTTIEGADVGGKVADEAVEAASDALEVALDTAITLTHDDVVYDVTLRELGAVADPEALVEDARAQVTTASLGELARMRWLGADSGIVVGLTLPDAGVTAFVDELADEVDRLARDASIRWTPEGAEIVPGEDGVLVDRATTAGMIHDAVGGGDITAELPVTAVAPDVTTADAERALPAVHSAVEDALDQPVRVVGADAEWAISGRELDAVPMLEAVVQHALGVAAAEPSPEQASQLDEAAEEAIVPLRVSRPALLAFVGDLASAADVQARDAALDWSSGWIEIEQEHAGQRVERLAMMAALEDAFATGTTSVELAVERDDPAVTTEAFDQVLLVRQDLRRLYLYVEGEIVREWPVAIGAPRSPTPAGVFEIGDKRHMPTWYNPAPNGWGADMPRVVGPGATNPLGLRALNWNRGDHDTLIRFHGTAQAGSIGRAASRGCIRLHNADVVELYDLVPSGVTIVSIWG